jgi:phosphoglycolate phosphatase
MADAGTSQADAGPTMEGFMSFRAIIFDLDGTLLDTLEDLADSYNRTLVKQGFPPHPTEAYRYFVGDGARMCMTRALPEESRDDETVTLCLEMFREDHETNWNVKTMPYRGVRGVIEALARRQIKLAVLSNKTQEGADRCMEYFFPDRKFDITIGHRESLPLKPDPSGAIEIATKLGVAPAEFIFLGDSPVDMTTALAAGMYPVGALWGFRPSKELRESGAAVVVERPSGVLDLLD